MASTNTGAPAADGKPKRPAGGRPNYNLIHKHPLPVTIEALPPLIPHNPLSVLTVVWAWLRATIWRPAPGPVYTGIFSPETRSVHITDPKTIRALWEAGFFGKGTLSRSEPTWLEREKRRRGLLAGETSEDVTRKRRQERKRFKEERARKTREDIEAKLRQERGEAVETKPGDAPSEMDGENGSVKVKSPVDGVDAAEKGMNELKLGEDNNGLQKSQSTGDVEYAAVDEVVVENLEHLQLSLEEAFFLAYGLGVLEVVLAPTVEGGPHEVIPLPSLFSLFRAYHTFPVSIPVSHAISPNDKFVANYAVYHHFRSLGWVIRPGPKFAVDWMLYNRGPPFSHAEFAVMTVPSYSHAFWKTEDGERMLREAGVRREGGAGGKSWHWLHMVNRVQSQVVKTLVLAYVEMPPPLSGVSGAGGGGGEQDEAAPTRVFQRMKVREIVLKRWTPNRNRD